GVVCGGPCGAGCGHCVGCVSSAGASVDQLLSARLQPHRNVTDWQAVRVDVALCSARRSRRAGRSRGSVVVGAAASLPLVGVLAGCADQGAVPSTSTPAPDPAPTTGSPTGVLPKPEPTAASSSPKPRPAVRPT